MKRLLAALLVAGAVVSSAGGATPERVLAVEWQAGGGQLRWVSATTLRPLGSAVLNVGGAPVDVTAVSPDRTLAALGGGAQGRVRFLDLERLRSPGVMWLGVNDWVAAGLWPAPDRLVLLSSGEPSAVVVVDPTAPRVVARRELPGLVKAQAATRDRLLALLAPAQGIGEARLAIVAADASVQTVALPGIRAGFAPPPRPGAPGKQALPGLAASPHGERAVVVGRDRFVVVDLDTRAVQTRSLLLRTPAKLMEGWGRYALWLGPRKVAVTGWTDSWADSELRHETAGVRLVDPTTGAARLLDPRAAGAARVGSTLLAYGGDALRGYGVDGRLRFELLQGHDTGYVQTAGRHAYVGSANSTRFAIVDASAGRVLRTVTTRRQTVILDPP